MVIDTMFSGESKNIEYKIILPIVAFANTQGGKLIVGVENLKWKVPGFHGMN